MNTLFKVKEQSKPGIVNSFKVAVENVQNYLIPSLNKIGYMAKYTTEEAVYTKKKLCEFEKWGSVNARFLDNHPDRRSGLLLKIFPKNDNCDNYILVQPWVRERHRKNEISSLPRFHVPIDFKYEIRKRKKENGEVIKIKKRTSATYRIKKTLELLKSHNVFSLYLLLALLFG